MDPSSISPSIRTSTQRRPCSPDIVPHTWQPRLGETGRGTKAAGESVVGKRKRKIETKEAEKGERCGSDRTERLRR